VGTQFPPSLDNGLSPHGYINQRLQIQFGAPDDERYTARNPPSLENGRSPHGYINQRLKIQSGAPDDERYAARNMLSLQ